MSRIPIALQLYSVRQECAADLPGTLRAVAKMGYEGVEFAGYHNHTARELRQLCDENGLKVVGTHIGLETLLGAELEKTVAFNQVLGNRYLIVPSLPEERRRSRAAWLETARIFDQIALQLAPHGLRTGYHNHHVEFTPLEGELPWDTFFSHTRKEVVMQLDIGNLYRGGAEPLGFLTKYPGRAQLIHLKEYSRTDDRALIGEGEVDWKKIFALCESIGGTEWYIVEQESHAYSPLECVDRCLQNLKRMGK